MKLEKIFQILCLAAIILPLGLLLVLLGQLFFQGYERLTWNFLIEFPSRKSQLAGIYPALMGSIMLISLSTLLAIPVGISAAIYLEEYAEKTLFAHLIELNVANLAGVPSVIYGLLGLEIFVRILNLGHSLLSGALTMALLMLPVMITAAREALKTVPNSYREACYALGSTQFQTIRQVVIPMAMPGILTGSILAISRAIGETAPLVVIGAATYMAFVPDALDSEFTVLPIQIFNWVSRPQKGFLIDAAAGIIVLVGTLFVLNLVAIFLRSRFERR
jgi:phosphate transport system permease protein